MRSGISAKTPIHVARWRATRSRRMRLFWLAVILIGPALLLRLFTSVYPLVYTGWMSLRNTNPAKNVDAFVGLANYERMFNDSRVIDTLTFTGIFTVGSVLLQLGASLVVASLINVPWRGRGLMRTVNLLPWAIPPIAAAVAARWFFQADYGMANDLLRRLPGNPAPVWFQSVWLARLAVILVDVWRSVPFLSILFLAGLQSVPEDIKEAARVDGASPLQSYFRITLPIMSPVIITMTIFITMWRVMTFDIQYGMTQGGPGTATSVLSFRVYFEFFRNLRFGYASTLGMVVFAVVLAVGVVGFLFLRLRRGQS